MSIRKVSFAENEYYHIYNRGNSKQKIFHDRQDYLHFMSILFACNSERSFRTFGLGQSETPYDFDRGKQLVAIGCYCLMPNHFHIVLTQKREGGISKFMQKLSTAYSMHYNKKYDRTGGLFEGKFKSEHIDEDRYFKYLFSYIHLNPIKLIQKDWREAGIKNKKDALNYLNDYSYSSYQDFIGIKRIQNQIVDQTMFPDYFPNPNSLLKEILSWINYKND